MRFAQLVPLALACGTSALPVVTLPWFAQISLSSFFGCLGYISHATEERTIYQVLKDDEQYTHLAKAIDLSESVVELLNDSSKSITFFAIPDSKLPRHRKHHDEPIPLLSGNLDQSSYDLGDLVLQAEELEEEPDSDDKKKRKEVLARIIPKIVAYHILPESYQVADLVKNSTYATNLTLSDGSLGGEPLRLSVLGTPIPPRLRINTFVQVTKKDIKAKNGIIHQINHPLLPPPSVFQETFFVPEVFSFFTTAVQRVGLVGAIDRWRSSEENGPKIGFSGAIATTAFAPTSGAFRRLPKKLRTYLFSPFGQKALKKLLEYHIVPSLVFHTDYFHNSTSDVTEFRHHFGNALETQFSGPFPPFFDGDLEDLDSFRNLRPSDHKELLYEYNVTLPTLLRDHHLRVHVARYKTKLPFPSLQYFTSFKVNGRHVGPFDIPARNGALHVVTNLLDPRKGRHHHGSNGETEEDVTSWENWEEWLPQWAVED